MSSDPIIRDGLQIGDRDILLVLRQSSLGQVSDHKGSIKAQIEQKKNLRQIGIDEDDIEVVNLLGESGRKDADRPKFEEVVRRIRAGEVGLLSLARHDRLGRNDRDSVRLFDAMEEQATLCMIGRRLYDLRQPSDELSLRMQATFAAYENKSRTRWMVLTRLAQVRKGESAIPVPNGLVWGNPEDRTFRRQMRNANLGDWLERIDDHEVSAPRNGDRWYVFPFPDAEVFHACRLRIQWALETRDLNAVVERIKDGYGEWPTRRQGEYPHFTQRVWREGMRPTWRDIDRPRYDARAGLRKWTGSPALYGTYEFHSDAATGPDEDPEEVIALEGAFPSFAEPEDRHRMQEIRQNSIKEPNQGNYHGPRNHVIETLLCNDETSDTGRQCGLTKTAVYPEREKGHKYTSLNCRRYGHKGRVHYCVDRTVLNIITEVFDADRLESAIRRVRLKKSNVLERRKELEARVNTLKDRIEACREAELDARADGCRGDYKDFQNDRKELRSKLEETESKLQQYREDEQEIRTAERQDLDRIQELASNLDELLERALALEEAERREWESLDKPEDFEFATEGLVRRIVAELVDKVYGRKLAEWTYEVTVQFPTGHSVSRVSFAQHTPSTQPQRAWAFLRLSEGANPEDIAAFYNEQSEQIVRKRSPWEPEMVKTAALMYREGERYRSYKYDEPETPREGEHQTIEELSQKLDEDPEIILREILGGYFGPVRIIERSLQAAPTREEIHERLPEVARRDVASEKAWPVEDTVPYKTIRQEKDHYRDWFERRISYGDGRAVDASGRTFVRRSDIEVSYRDLIDDALEVPENAEYRKLDRSHWMPTVEAREVLGVSYGTVPRHAPTMHLVDGAPTQRTVVAWIGPEIMEKFEQ